MRARGSAPRVPLPKWRVRVSAHTTCERYPIEAATVTLPAPTADVAIDFAIGEAHSRAGVPPWSPCRDESRKYATVKRVRS